MKHPITNTLELIGWFIASIIIGMLLIPRATKHASALSIDVSPWLMILILAIGIAVGTAFWLLAFKFWNRKYVVEVFAFGIGTMIMRTMILFYPQINDNVWDRLTIILLSALIYYAAVKAMQKSWELVINVYYISNAFMIVAIPTTAAVVGQLLPWWTALLMLALVGVYDAIAVWKTKHMVTLAMGFIDLRVIPGICVPYMQEQEDGNYKGSFALLGGGDIFFIVLVAASFYKLSHALAYISAATMVLSVIALFAYSRKEKFYPAIPFIFAGCGAGFIIWLLGNLVISIV